MIDPVTASLILGGLNMGMGFLGGRSAAKARKAADFRRRQITSDYLQGADANLQALRDRNARALWTATGTGGDALNAAASGLGDRMANAGVYNSSATAGALAKGQTDLLSQIANLAAANYANEAQVAGQNRLEALRMALGYANEDYAAAQQQQQQSNQGVMDGLMTIGGGIIDKYVKPATPAAAAAPIAKQAGGNAPSVRANSRLPGTAQQQIQSFQQDRRYGGGMGQFLANTPVTNGTMNWGGSAMMNSGYGAGFGSGVNPFAGFGAQFGAGTLGQPKRRKRVGFDIGPIKARVAL